LTLSHADCDPDRYSESLCFATMTLICQIAPHFGHRIASGQGISPRPNQGKSN
jgi:hypothetical protein